MSWYPATESQNSLWIRRTSAWVSRHHTILDVISDMNCSAAMTHPPPPALPEWSYFGCMLSLPRQAWQVKKDCSQVKDEYSYTLLPRYMGACVYPIQHHVSNLVSISPWIPRLYTQTCSYSETLFSYSPSSPVPLMGTHTSEPFQLFITAYLNYCQTWIGSAIWKHIKMKNILSFKKTS